MKDKTKAVAIIKKAQDDLDSGKISRREFNFIMMNLGVVAGYAFLSSSVAAWTGTRMRKSSGTISNYQIQRSLRLRSSNTAYLSRTAVAPTSTQKGSISVWVKKTLNAPANRQHIYQSSYNTAPYRSNSLSFETSDKICFGISYQISVGGSWNQQIELITNAVYRDPSAWYHIVVNWDTTQATASDRAKMWVNGVQVTSFSTGTYPALNDNLTIDTSGFTNFIGDTNGKGVFTQGTPFDGYIADFYRVDGQALTASSFGKFDTTTGSWTSLKYTGACGANGFYLPFTDTSNTTNLVKDTSPSNNNWTPNNISLTAGATYDSMTDVPLNYLTTDRGNFAVLNQLDHYPANSGGTITDGGLKWTTTAASNPPQGYNFAWSWPSSGKFYFEVEILTINIDGTWGFIEVGPNYEGGSYLWSSALVGGAQIVGSVGTFAISQFVVGSKLMFAVDCDNGKVWYGRDGTWYTTSGSPDPAAGTGWSHAFSTFGKIPYVTGRSGTGGVNSIAANFGQRPFSYTPPTGFKALHTGNLSTPAIANPKKHFDIAKYAGTGASLAISANGLGDSLQLAPDLVWIKTRTNTYYHKLVDKVRGPNKVLTSNATDAELTETQGLMSFDANGFTLGTSSDSTVNNSGSGQTYVAWLWKAGGSANSNTNGTVTSQVSVNTTSGFSIVTYTGTLSGNGTFTVGHGLSTAPSMIFTKSRSATSDWIVMHKSLPSWNHAVFLQSTTGYTDQSPYGSRSAPTSSVFTANYTTGLGINGHTHVAYCFSEVEGFSKIGSYATNGSSDGVFVHLGFRPRFILIKASTNASNWFIWDTSRTTYNVSDFALFPNLSSQELGTYLIDILSNGFKLRVGTGYGYNETSNTVIYAAFAEAPFKYANAR